MKTNLTLANVLVALFVVLICSSARAQRSVPAPYRASYNQMMSNNMKGIMNQNMRFAQSMMMYKYRYSPDLVENDEYIFNVVLKDGSERIVESRIYADTALHTAYLVLDNPDVPRKDPARKTKIYANQTVKISRQDDAGEAITGNANDTCWQFKVISGKINAYSYLSEVEGIDSFYLSAFQAGDDGPIQNLTKEALEPIIKSDEKAYKAFLKKDYYNAIKAYNKSHK